MVAIKDYNMPSCCRVCELNIKNIFCQKTNSKFEDIEYRRNSDCPLVEIGTCKDCKYYTVYEIEYFQTNQKEQFSYCEKYERLGNNHLSPDFYCGDFKKRGSEK